MKYIVGFERGPNGNQIKEKSILSVKIEGAHFFSGAVYKKGSPVIAFQTIPGDDYEEVVVHRKGMSLRGKAELRIRAFDRSWRGQGWDDEFEIV